MNTITFSDPNFWHIAWMPQYTIQQIKDEPMLFNCDLEHAHRYGGELTQSLLKQLPFGWLNVPLVIDTKSVMLMTGWYACIPGWHHDDVERKGQWNQPDYRNKDKHAEFIMTVLNADVAPTEFFMEGITLPLLEQNIYAEWDKQISEKVAKGAQVSKVVDRGVYQFDDCTFHRGVAAVKPGWRWFARVSRYYDKTGPIPRANQRTNEIRKQVQVYMPTINAGW